MSQSILDQVCCVLQLQFLHEQFVVCWRARTFVLVLGILRTADNADILGGKLSAHAVSSGSVHGGLRGRMSYSVITLV